MEQGEEDLLILLMEVVLQDELWRDLLTVCLADIV